VDIAIGLEEGDSAKAILAWMSDDNQNLWKNVQSGGLSVRHVTLALKIFKNL
jgi:hypothetical protein